MNADTSKLRTAVIGLGKMGISHLSVVNAHPLVQLVGVCDTSRFIGSALQKLTDLRYYPDYRKMLQERDLDAVIIATPTASHYSLVMDCLRNGLHVFVEKPFSLHSEEGIEMVDLASRSGLVNQVGYHNRFIATFRLVKDLLDDGIIGDPYAIHGEAYGPVVLRAKGSTWRSRKSEGGGCLHDYVSHVVDLMNYYLGPPRMVSGTVLQRIFSDDVEDAVYSTLHYPSGALGQLSVNWSEPSYRKMSTSITIRGRRGKIIVDRQECKVFLESPDARRGLKAGWNVLYTTDLTVPVWFYVRGEEYSAQVDHFVRSSVGEFEPEMNSFASAFATDGVISMLNQDAESIASATAVSG